MNRWLGLAVSGVLLIASPATRADEDSDRVVKELLQSGITNGTREIARNWLNTQGSIASIPTGSAISGSIDLGFAVHDFLSATNDKGRLFAGLRAGSATYILASGPYAPAVAIAVAIAAIVDAGVSARHAAHLMEIYARAARDEAEAIRLLTTIAKSDGEAIYATIVETSKHLSIAVESATGIQDKCGTAEGLRTLDDLNNCVLWASSYHVHAQHFVTLATALLSWNSQYVNVGVVFKVAGVDAKLLAEERDRYRAAIQAMSGHINQLLARYGELSADLIIRSALDSPVFSTKEYVAYNCIDAAAAIARDGDELALARLAFQGTAIEFAQDYFRLRVDAFERSTAALDETGCRTFANIEGDEPERILLRHWLEHLRSTTDSLLTTRTTSSREVTTP